MSLPKRGRIEKLEEENERLRKKMAVLGAFRESSLQHATLTGTSIKRGASIVDSILALDVSMKETCWQVHETVINICIVESEKH